MDYPRTHHQQHLREKGLTPFFHRNGLFFCLLFHDREREPTGAITAALLSDQGGPHYSLWYGANEWVQVIIADHSSPNEAHWTLRDPGRDPEKFYPSGEIFMVLAALRKAGEAYRNGGTDGVEIIEGISQ